MRPGDDDDDESDDFDALPDYGGSAPDKEKLRPKPRSERAAKRRIRIKPARTKSNETAVVRRGA